ncbi:hypothetical protein PMAG_a1343 [Pseudoalteromonas mariniglutinosa NCIMB 1770]|nr:hypothetical protein [Pseudoalteromonas mariniglutinosa NCIMB 1770]
MPSLNFNNYQLFQSVIFIFCEVAMITKVIDMKNMHGCVNYSWLEIMTIS